MGTGQEAYPGRKRQRHTTPQKFKWAWRRRNLSGDWGLSSYHEGHWGQKCPEEEEEEEEEGRRINNYNMTTYGVLYRPPRSLGASYLNEEPPDQPQEDDGPARGSQEEQESYNPHRHLFMFNHQGGTHRRPSAVWLSTPST